MTEPGDLPDSEITAASLALGLLEGSERSKALRLLLKDPEFARRVGVWQQVGDRWLEEVEPVDAPAGLLDRIDACLDGVEPHVGATRPDDRSTVAGVWRTWAITATVASLALAIGLGLAVNGRLGKRETTGPQVAVQQSANVAQIDSADGTPLVSALYNPASGMLSLRLANLDEPDRGPELWVIPEDGVPRSLGMIGGDKLTITISPQLRALLSDGANMAITLEPKDGRRHEAPTGSILGTGQLQAVPQQLRS